MGRFPWLRLGHVLSRDTDGRRGTSGLGLLILRSRVRIPPGPQCTISVAHALGWSSVVSAWGGKNGSPTSTLVVGEPIPIALRPDDMWRHARIRTTRSAGTEAWKQEVAAQLADVEPLPTPGMAEMAIAISVSPGRNWGNVWKPAIDATGRILGASSSTRTWHPRDGRITRLGLSLSVDSSLGWDIILDYWWRPA
jgi:hypothetical protein